MRKTIIYLGLLILLSSFVFAAQCSTTESDYTYIDYTDNGSTVTSEWTGRAGAVHEEGLVGYDGAWKVQGNASLKTTNKALEASTNLFDPSNSLIAWWNVSYSGSTTDLRRTFGIGPDNGAICAMGFNTLTAGLLGYGASEQFVTSTSLWGVNSNKQFQTMMQLNGSDCVFYARNTTSDSWELVASATQGTTSFTQIFVAEGDGGDTGEFVNFDKYWAFNYTTEGECLEESPDTTPPTITNLNCTSCVEDSTPDVAPYETEDTTPTFKFNTSEVASCVIGRNDENYTTMNATNNGTCSGDGTIGPHVCTLPVKDRFTTTGHNIVHISCIDGSGNENTTSSSGQLVMNTLGATETGGDDRIKIGIDASEIAGMFDEYPEQQISARDLANNQFTGTFDWVVAVQGSTIRYAFNYVSSGESPITPLFNLTPVLYVLQLQNQTNETITDQVGKLINSTYP